MGSISADSDSPAQSTKTGELDILTFLTEYDVSDCLAASITVIYIWITAIKEYDYSDEKNSIRVCCVDVQRGQILALTA